MPRYIIKFIKSIDKSENTQYNINCYGEVAQLARATGSYPVGREFESPSRYQKSAEKLIFLCNKNEGKLS